LDSANAGAVIFTERPGNAGQGDQWCCIFAY
jgi:hypothetical protein